MKTNSIDKIYGAFKWNEDYLKLSVMLAKNNKRETHKKYWGFFFFLYALLFLQFVILPYEYSVINSLLLLPIPILIFLSIVGILKYKELPLWWIFNVLICYFLYLISTDGFVQPTISFNNSIIVIICIILVRFSALIIHQMVVWKMLSELELNTKFDKRILFHFKPNSIEGIVKKSLKFLFSPDYFYAGLYKERLALLVADTKKINLEELEYLRHLKKIYIERSNWLNIRFTIFISILSVYLGVLIDLNNKVIFFIIVFLVYRILSRVIEIVLAFYNDIVTKSDKFFYKASNNVWFTRHSDLSCLVKDKEKIFYKEKVYIHDWKNSLLLPSSRTSLALHSLMEIILIFGTLFIFMDLSKTFQLANPLLLKESEVEQDYVEQLRAIKYYIYSASNGITLPEIKPTNYWAIAQIVQLTTSLILIIMSFSFYLGKDKNLLESEYQLYKEYHRKNDEGKV